MKSKLVVFDEKYIMTFSKSINPQYVDQAYEYICNIMDNAFDFMCKKRAVVTEYSYEIVNECVTYSENQNSSLDIFVKVKSPQLELGVLKLNNNYFKKFFNKVKWAWNSSKKQKKKRKWFFKKSSKEQEPKENLINLDSEKYNIKQFKIDYMNTLANYLSEETKLFVNNFGITILAEEEIGMNINLYFAFNNGEKYKLFNQSLYKLIEVDFGSRLQNIELKNKSTNNNFTAMLRIFNGLYENVMEQHLNQILIESLLFECPDELYTGSTYNMFLKIFNYIKINEMQKFHSITNQNILVFQDNLVTTKVSDFLKFLNNVQKLL